MAKPELNEKIEFEKAVGVRGGFFSTLISIIKFVLSIILLPFVIGLTINFRDELIKQEWPIVNSFIIGLISYVILHIFIFVPQKIFDFGQMIIGKLFGFFIPLRTLAYNCLSFYACISVALYFVLKNVFGYQDLLGYFIFLISFTVLMHLVMTASYLRDQTIDGLKGAYFFSLFWIYIFNIILVSVFFKFMLDDFSFLRIVKDSFVYFIQTIDLIWRQLFVVR